MAGLKTHVAAAVAALCPLMLASSGWAADEKVHADADIWGMVTAIAGPTAGAKLGGGQQAEKAVTIARNANGEAGVTSMQALGAGSKATFPAGTLALLIAHYPGQCSAPYADDDYAASQGVETFVVSASGDYIWEVAKTGGAVSVRLVQGHDAFGPWEPFQKNPAGYRTYRCEAYR
jgi:hypothetical protein